MSSVVIPSEQLERFQRLNDRWQRQTSGQNQELFEGPSSLLDQRKPVKMPLSTPGSPRRDRINQAVLQPRREISPHRCFVRRSFETGRRAAQRRLGDRSGNTDLTRDSVSRPDWEGIVGRRPWNGAAALVNKSLKWGSCSQTGTEMVCSERRTPCFQCSQLRNRCYQDSRHRYRLQMDS